MKSAVLAFALSLPLLSLLAPRSSATADSVPSAAGAGTVAVGEDLKAKFEFTAVTQEDGSATGRITLINPAEIPNQDVDGTDEPGLDGLPSGIEVTAEVDSLEVKGYRAVLSGVVTSTTHPRYAGLRVILAVEDNGARGKASKPDKITWGVYPREAVRPATDAENPEAGEHLVGKDEPGSRSFPLSAYSLSYIAEGDIQVHP